ncbi:MAG: hypothetical protein LBI80_04515 [Endomicrobium sp.]|jgi:hypothetical protein|nr:hypothetical protein [Endomicrobium sp.]
MKNLPFAEVITKLWKINKSYVILFLVGKLKDVPFPMLGAFTHIDSLVSNKSLLKVFYLLLLFLVLELTFYFFDSWFNIKYEPKKKEIISKTL